MSEGAVQVRGLRELTRAFKQLDDDTRRELRSELRSVAEPVKRSATQHAIANISNIGDHWSRMRIGVTMSLVYVAPLSRRRGGSPRPKLAPLLQEAMDEGLDDNQGRIVSDLDSMLGRLAGENGF